MSTVIHRLIREPTLHFLLLAGLLFLVYGLRNEPRAQPLVIDWQDVAARVTLDELGRGAPFTDEERRQREQALLDDHILILEARAQGLDNDPRINDILAQKMRHVLSGEVAQPTDAELADYYQANRQRYEIAPSVTVEELVFGTRDPLPEAVNSQLRDGLAMADIVAELPATRGILPRVSLRDLASIFHPEFARLAFDAPSGVWTGPFPSNRGQHWLRVTERLPGGIRPLDEVEELVRLDWITDMEEARLAVEIQRLRQKYDITFLNRPSE